MHNINIGLEDEEFEALSAVKGGMTWREFVLSLIPSEDDDVEPKQENTEEKTIKNLFEVNPLGKLI